MDKLPERWTITEIEHLLVPLDNGKCLQQGWSPQCDSEPARNGDWGVLKTTSIQDGAFLAEHNKRLPLHLQPRQNIAVRIKDILMTCAGPRSRCGVVCLVRHDVSNLMMSGKMYRFRTDESLASPEYLELFLRSRNAQAAIDRMKTGINDSGLNLTHDRFKKLGVPLPPLAEQHRIVAKIEELFSELDQGVVSLKTAREQLKVYRQSLLKNAFEGKLTATWRTEHRDQLESATALQQRIAHEREARYQQQLADWQSQGKPGPKPNPPKPLPPLTPEELAELPELPEGWDWVKLAALIDEPAYGTSKKCDYETAGVGVLRIPNVVSGKVDATDLKFAQFSPEETAAYRLETGDLLMIRSNGSVSIVGKCALVSPLDTAYLYAGYLIRLRPLQPLVLPAYLAQLLSSHELRKQIEYKAKSTSGVNNINSGEIQSLALPICGLTEQELILAELESKLSEADQLDQTLATALQQADALRQSILKKAFCGQLVKQDKNDEPAAALLERIRAERLLASGKKTRSTAGATR